LLNAILWSVPLIPGAALVFVRFPLCFCDNTAARRR
jgi:hypothetical protein